MIDQEWYLDSVTLQIFRLQLFPVYMDLECWDMNILDLNSFNKRLVKQASLQYHLIKLRIRLLLIAIN